MFLKRLSMLLDGAIWNWVNSYSESDVFLSNHKRYLTARHVAVRFGL